MSAKRRDERGDEPVLRCRIVCPLHAVLLQEGLLIEWSEAYRFSHYRRTDFCYRGQDGVCARVQSDVMSQSRMSASGGEEGRIWLRQCFGFQVVEGHDGSAGCRWLRE